MMTAARRRLFFWLSEICRDGTPYMVLGAGRIANPTCTWRHTTLISNEAFYLGLRGG
jgi:hypothetical protein